MTAVSFPQKYDDRFAHNPPSLTAPAMGQEQFDYDNQREIEAHLLTNPVVMAHTIMMIKDQMRILNDRLELLELSASEIGEPTQ